MNFDAKIKSVRLMLEDEYNPTGGSHDKKAQVQVNAKIGTDGDSINIILTRDQVEQLGGLEKLKAGDYITISITKAPIQEE